VEIYTSCWEALIIMGVIVLLSLSREMKETRPILSQKRRPCCGIKDWGILEKRPFKHYTVKDMVEGMSNCTLDFDFCEHCIYGKHNRVRFPSGATREKGILELIHIDVFVPVPIPSLGKSVYYVSFIDDFSRNTWIYFLRNKSEVFDKFKEFKALVENQTEKKIKVLRTDNGGEFCRNEFEEFCKKCGISRQKTTPYTPQQNGVAERMNRTLMEKARSMLSGAGIGQ
jgi:transposase InsO family protein